VCFQILFSCPAIPSLAHHGLAQHTSPPCTVPSEAYAHAGGLGARLFREGRETAYASQFSKKKIMKTTKKLTKGLLADTANLVPAETAPAAAAQSAVPPVGQSGTDKKDSRLPIDAEARKKNRTLPTPKVLELLKTSNPGLFNLAEVVGKWVWVTFRETPAPELRQILAQLGFHWNRERQAWQHPCGAFRLRGAGDPHEKYASYYPADSRAA
jgi:hypothetical protein